MRFRSASSPVLISRHHTSSTSFLPLRAASFASTSASSSASAATAASVPLLPLPRTAGTACRRPLSCIRRQLPPRLPVLVEGPNGSVQRFAAPLALRLHHPRPHHPRRRAGIFDLQRNCSTVFTTGLNHYNGSPSARTPHTPFYNRERKVDPFSRIPHHASSLHRQPSSFQPSSFIHHRSNHHRSSIIVNPSSFIATNSTNSSCDITIDIFHRSTPQTPSTRLHIYTSSSTLRFSPLPEITQTRKLNNNNDDRRPSRPSTTTTRTKRAARRSRRSHG